MSRRPNILLVMADQLAGPALPLDGSGVARTPNLQQLADSGVVFENAYCNFPICAPSRASMMAGLLPHNFDQFDNSSEFPAAIPTIPHYLRQLDYRTILSGKMHFIGPDQLHGFESRITTEIYPANFAWTVDWTRGREFRPTNLTMAAVKEAGPCVRSLQIDYDDEVEYHSVQAIYDLARESDDKPFFLTASFTHPHSPFVTSQEYWDRYQHDEIPEPSVGPLALDEMDHLSRNLHYCQGRDVFNVDAQETLTARHAYFGMISYIDDKLGALMQALRHTGLDENTIVIFTADHGEMMGERGMWYKQHFFEWASRVPLIVSAPERYQSARIKANVSLLDLLPTLVDIGSAGTGIEYAETPQGHSLKPYLESENDVEAFPVIAEYSADGSTGPSRMVLQHRIKYMYLEGVDECLYDLDQDPLESNNLVDDVEYQSRLEELRAIAFADWDPVALRQRVLDDQQQRLFIQRVTQGDPAYVYALSDEDLRKYVRNAGAADTKSRARFPYVKPSAPDIDAARNG